MPSKILINFNELSILEFLVQIDIAPSKSEAKRLIENNGISFNQEKISNSKMIITKNDFPNNEIIVQKGKKTFVKAILK